MKNLKFLLLLPLLTAFQCDEDEMENLENNNLNETGLMGSWEIADETRDGISDMLPKCCRFLEFYTDSDPDDYTGSYTFTDDQGLTYNGEFTVNLSDGLITFDNFDDDLIIYDYSVDDSGEGLIFSFTENEVKVIQNWTKTN
ncbi:hypothetical protein LB456_11945 [Psychroflexus sp. CAK57W]|uniref:hypothetical protein n=1 Tax=Psychroflexus curvus TaxID=2873595 RepID=UPI001CC9DD93|nr:hypothetical protein [Psychroflexus curvus]MBZ9788171.1 hypothetical protein [Psychroflexus curvus]